MTNEKRIDPLLNMETVGGERSTAPTNNPTTSIDVLGHKLGQELLDSGISIENQKFLSYRRVSPREAFKLTGHEYAGWLVLYTDPKGKPYTHNGNPFYRLKPDSGQIKGHDAPKYLTAKGAGNRPYFSPFLDSKHISEVRDVVITEGEKKTDSLTIHGFPTIGLAGVWSWKDGRSGGMLPELEAINWRGRNTFIVFDSDVVLKDPVKKALEALCNALTEKGANVRVATLPMDLDGSKNGADDFLVKYGREALRQLLGKARDSHKNRKFIWKDEPTLSHHTAVTASVVFKNTYALRPAIGLYKWVGTRWEHLAKRKPKDAITTPLHNWLDHQNWENRTSHHLNSITSELLARIEHPEWDSKHLMSFKNGTFNINKQTFNKSHNRKDYLTHSFDFNFSPDAKCPTWIKFLNESFSNNQEIIELLKAAFKWTIFPKDNSRAFLMELIFDLYGRRGSGKSTTLEVLQAVAGNSYGVIKPSTLKPTELFSLIGKKIAYDSDSSGHISDAGKLDKIISNEPVLVKQLFFNETFERLGVVIWRAFNDNPTVSGGGVEGLGRRMLTFKFEKTAANPDPHLKNKLLAEIEGIFQWCWSMDDNKMFEVLRNRGNIESITKATIENLLDTQPALQFIYEFAGDSEQRYKASEIYSKYCDWCNESGKHRMTSTNFGKELGKMEGFVQKEFKTDANYYVISKFKEINLAKHFGITTNGQLNPPSRTVANPNPPASNPPINKGNDKSMDSMDSSNNKNSFKNKKENINRKEFSQQTLQTLQPSITGSSWDTDSGDDPFWDEM